MRPIIYTSPSGGLVVVYPVINTKGEKPGFTEEDAEQRAWKKLPKDAINPHFAEAGEVPGDRTFRDAWKDDNGVTVDMPKAREIHRAKLRVLREPKLEALDVEYLRADEVGDTVRKIQIASQKQILRDVTADPRIDSAVTPEELKAVIPDELK